MYNHTISETTLTFPEPSDSSCLKTGWERWDEAQAGCADPQLAEFMRQMPADRVGSRALAAIFGNSPYLTLSLLKEPDILQNFLTLGPDAAFFGIMTDLRAQAGEEMETARLMVHLRRAKRRAALLIALADLSGVWSLERLTRALTELADDGLSLALRGLLRQGALSGNLTLAHPDDPERDSGYFILAMGKQGAGELNYSSDIDLIVIYDEDKAVYTGTRTIQEYFVRMTRDLVRIMEERTGDGYVFRTDLRLRPDPGSTPLAVALSTAEAYYEGYGQNWERAAMIKARCVAGDRAAGEAFLKFLRPFIWRKSLDFYAIRDIHSIKRQIHAHKGGGSIAVAGHNIKLGRGGIREIEFFAQTQQLIWGGRMPDGRTSRTLEGP